MTAPARGSVRAASGSTNRVFGGPLSYEPEPPQHTALLGEWAIGKTSLLMHWRRRLEEGGDRVVLTMAYPQSRDDFLAALAGAVAAETDSGWTANVDLEVGLDVGVAEARLRKPVREVEKELRGALRGAARVGDRHTLIVMVDDVDLVATPGDALLQLRASAWSYTPPTSRSPSWSALRPDSSARFEGPMNRSCGFSSPSRSGRSPRLPPPTRSRGR